LPPVLFSAFGLRFSFWLLASGSFFGFWPPVIPVLFSAGCFRGFLVHFLDTTVFEKALKVETQIKTKVSKYNTRKCKKPGHSEYAQKALGIRSELRQANPEHRRLNLQDDKLWNVVLDFEHKFELLV